MSLLKSYGSVLRDHPEVDKVATEFYTFKINPTDTIDVKKIPKRMKAPSDADKLPISEIIPKSFRGHHVWANYITLPEYLEGCGDGWALSVCHCVSDRFSIFSLGQINPVIDSDEIIYCGDLKRPTYMSNVKSQSLLDLKNICVGYSVYDAARYIYQNGISEAACFNQKDIKKRGYKELSDYKDLQQLKKDIPTCDVLLGDQLEHCVDVKLPRRVFRILSFINVDGTDIGFNTIKYEIYRYGPVVAGFLMYKDFLDKYDGTTIYKGPPPGTDFVGGHSVRILGWGRDSKENIDFWILANNWSTAWGEGGYFRMKMGILECQLEKNVTAPIVNLSHLNYTYEPADVLRVPDDLHSKNPPMVIRETLFTPYTTQLLRDGKIDGDLNPLIYKDFKIDSPSFWAGDTDWYVKNYQDIGASEFIIKKKTTQPTKKSRNVILLVVSIILIGIITGYFLFRFIQK
jgi:hypothetical protein